MPYDPQGVKGLDDDADNELVLYRGKIAVYCETRIQYT